MKATPQYKFTNRYHMCTNNGLHGLCKCLSKRDSTYSIGTPRDSVDHGSCTFGVWNTVQCLANETNKVLGDRKNPIILTIMKFIIYLCMYYDVWPLYSTVKSDSTVHILIPVRLSSPYLCIWPETSCYICYIIPNLWILDTALRL